MHITRQQQEWMGKSLSCDLQVHDNMLQETCVKDRELELWHTIKYQSGFLVSRVITYSVRFLSFHKHPCKKVLGDLWKQAMSLQMQIEFVHKSLFLLVDACKGVNC
jgi:hypothetical protein